MLGIIRKDMTYVTENQKRLYLKKVIDILNNNSIDYWLEFGTLLCLVRDKKFIKWDSDVDIGTKDIRPILDLRTQFEKSFIVDYEEIPFGMKKVSFKSINESERACFHIEVFEFKTKNEFIYYQWLIRRNIIARFCNTMYVLLEGEKVVKPGIVNITTMKKLNTIIRKIPKYCKKIISNIFCKLDITFSIKRRLYFKDTDLINIGFYDMIVNIPSNYQEHLLLNYGITWKIPQKVSGMGGEEFVWKKVNNIEYCVLPKDRGLINEC